MPLAVETYKQVLKASGLVAEEQLGKALQQLSQQSASRPLDSQILSQYLLEQKILTPWQNSKLMKGCSKGFFIGRYKLLAHLGTGGMSRVYLAVHTMMKRQVAIKVLNQKLTESPSHLERFLRESQAAAGLDHPNVVRAHDVDCERGLYYFVMEYVEGPTLQHLVEKKGPLDYEYAAEYIRQSALGLQHAHDAGLVHRDIKPGNLLVNQNGVVKVLDLGMVRLSSEEVKSITIQFNESMLGTADYLAPEQALDSHNVDHRADIYSLGCTFYFLLTGHPPFAEGSMAMRLMRHQSEPPPDILKERPDCPQELIDVCLKLMAKQTDDRYQSGNEVAGDLQAWLDAWRNDRRHSSVIPDHHRAPLADDTVAEAAPYTVVTPAAAAKIVSAGQSSPAVSPAPHAAADVMVPGLSQPAALRPAAAAESQSAAAAATATAGAPRPTDPQSWRYRDFESAMVDGDPHFITAVETLCRKFAGNEKVVAFMVKLVSSPGAAQHRLQPEILRSMLAGIGSLKTKAALKTLMRIVVGNINLQVNDREAVSEALHVLAAHPTPESERFLVEVMANAEDARPAGKSEVAPADLREGVVAALEGRLSDRLKQELQNRLGYRSLPAEARTKIEQLLAQ